MLRTFTSAYFAVGFVVGVLTSLFITLKQSSHDQREDFNTTSELNINNLQKPYENWFKKTTMRKTHFVPDQLRYNHTEHFYLEAQFLYNKIKVLCFVLVKNERNAQAANQTWGLGCNKIVFITVSKGNKRMPVKKTKESSTWSLLCKAFLDVSIEEYDWFLVVQDTTFVLLENLRYMIAALDPNEGFYLGHAVSFWNTIYNTGQAGYVLSKRSLEVLKNRFNTSEACIVSTTYLNQEDFYLGKVLSSLGVQPKDTKDEEGLSVFHSYNWQQEFFPTHNYYKSSVYPSVCCSKRSVTFQAIEADKIYMYYYLIYTLQVFKSGSLGNRAYANTIPDEVVWRSFLQEKGYDYNFNVTSKQYYDIWVDVVHDPAVFNREISSHKFEYYDD